MTATRLGAGQRVAVLGAGMLGSCTALLFARRGLAVSLFDAQPAPMRCAGRWNEGKIHRGYIYSADATLNTARTLLPGAGSFERIVSSLIDEPVGGALTRGPDLLLTHVDSVVPPDETYRYLKAVWDLGCDAGIDVSPPERLSERQRREITEHPSIVAAFTTPEQSIDTNWVADRLVARLQSEGRVQSRFGERVIDLIEHDSKWSVVTDNGVTDGFDLVVNALWEGKAAIDAKRGWSPAALSYRYRLSVFADIDASDLPNFVIATGPFGDFKNYGKSLYMSWYPAGLLVNAVADRAPETPRLSEEQTLAVGDATIDTLAEFFPTLHEARKQAHAWKVRGGWVVARGQGPLSALSSGLHKRDSFGIERRGSYFSVDAGKYSMAPLLAERIVEQSTG